MQKNLSQSERYTRGYCNLMAGAIIILIVIIINLLSGCEPVLPDDHKKREALSSETDSTYEKQPEINEWGTDTTTYQSQAKPQ